MHNMGVRTTMGRVGCTNMIEHNNAVVNEGGGRKGERECERPRERVRDREGRRERGCMGDEEKWLYHIKTH